MKTKKRKAGHYVTRLVSDFGVDLLPKRLRIVGRKGIERYRQYIHLPPLTYAEISRPNGNTVRITKIVGSKYR